MDMDEVIYNIPLSLWKNYRQRLTILRSANVNELTAMLREADRSNIISVQILSPGGDSVLPADGLFSLPVDLRLVNVEKEYPNLYQWMGLLAEGPARVSIPVVAGFSKAVKLAVALGFAVKLETTQPDAAAILEMRQVLDLYLHRPGIHQPIEFFHSLLLACYHDQPASLWAIQEEDPAEYCFVTDAGKEIISERFVGEEVDVGEVRTFLARFMAGGMLNQGGECRDCEHFKRCAGYFKWPDPTYRCEGIKGVLRAIRNAGEELKQDTAAFSARQETAST